MTLQTQREPTAPPARAADPESGSPPPPAPSRAPAAVRRRGDRRVWWIALGISALVHLVFLALYPMLTRPGTAGGPVPAPVPRAQTAGGVEVVRLVEVDATADPDEPEAPVVPTEARPTAPSVGPTGEPGADAPGVVAPGPTAAERLRVQRGDPRLWAPVDPALTRLSDEQRLELELAGRLEAWRDSVRVAMEAERSLTDWTVTDGDGGRWGVSPGKLHLGDITLPLPFGFGVNSDRRDEINKRAWEWEEIERARAAGQVRDSWKDRAQAIRERRDQERARARPDTSGVRR